MVAFLLWLILMVLYWPVGLLVAGAWVLLLICGWVSDHRSHQADAAYFASIRDSKIETSRQTERNPEYWEYHPFSSHDHRPN